MPPVARRFRFLLLLALLILCTLRGALTHPLLRAITTVTNHDMHHSRLTGNYGLYFTWWDRWMGTGHPAYPEEFKAVTIR